MKLFNFALYLLVIQAISARRSRNEDDEDEDSDLEISEYDDLPETYDDTKEKYVVPKSKLPPSHIVQIFHSPYGMPCDPRSGRCPPLQDTYIYQPSYLPYPPGQNQPVQVIPAPALQIPQDQQHQIPYTNQYGYFASLVAPPARVASSIGPPKDITKAEHLYVNNQDLKDPKVLHEEIMLAKKYVEEFQKYLETHPLMAKKKSKSSGKKVKKDKKEEVIVEKESKVAKKLLDDVETLLSKPQPEAAVVTVPPVVTTIATTTTTVAPESSEKKKSKKKGSKKSKKNKKKKKTDEEEDEEEEAEREEAEKEGEELEEEDNEFEDRGDSYYDQYPDQYSYRGDIYQSYQPQYY